MADQTIYDEHGRPVSTAKPVVYDETGKVIEEPGLISRIASSVGEPLVNMGVGAAKSVFGMPVNLVALVNSVAANRGNKPAQFMQEKLRRMQAGLAPVGGFQTAGGIGADLASGLVGGEGINLAADVIGQGAKDVVGPIAARVARGAVQGAGQATLAAAQGGSPAVAGALGATVPILGPSVAPAIERSAEDTMFKALGRPGSNAGPAGRKMLLQAQAIVPRALDEGFGAITQNAAMSKAQGMLSEASGALNDAWTQTVAAGGATANANVTPVLRAIQRARTAMTLPVASAAGAVRTPVTGSEAAYEQLGALMDELQSRADANGNVPMTALRKVRQVWDNAAKWETGPIGNDTATSQMYRLGANLVRQTIGRASPAVAEANKDYAFAQRLVNVLAKSTERPASSGLVGQIATLGTAGVGGAIGAHFGGAEGAGVGAATGALLDRLVHSPGWRYVSANAKQSLANALDAGDQGKIGQMLVTLASQAGVAIQGE